MGLQRWGGLMEGEAALASLLSRCPRRGAPEAQHSKRKEPGWLLRPKEQLQQRQALELQCRQYTSARCCWLATAWTRTCFESRPPPPLFPSQIPDTYILFHLPHLWLPFPSALIRVTARLLFHTSFASHARQTLLEFPGPPGAWLPSTSHLHPASPHPRLSLP